MRVICYLRTIFELHTVISTYINLGAIYIAHDYQEIESQKPNEQVLRCKTCGSESVGKY